MDTERIILTDNWKFHYGECEEAWYKGYDDSTWEEVTIPHDFSVKAPFSKEFSSGTGYLRGGIAWYRTSVRIPEEYRGKRITLIFDGIYKNSYVWVNSYFLGKRPSGYAQISYDISDRTSFGDEKLQISVKVVHTDIADSRWFTGSGITRKVSIMVSEKTAPVVDGIFFKSDSVENDGDMSFAKVSVRNELLTAGADSVVVSNTLFDEDGNAVLTMKSEQVVPEGDTAVINLSGSLNAPKLWSPDSPYLYTLETGITAGDTSYVTDRKKVGIRTFSFDPDEGFFLNGESMKFKGVCVHHDGGCLGAAMKKEVWRRRLELLKKSGCNAIRCSHNPHMPELYDLCDELGFMMMDEAFDEWENPKNKWSTGHNVYPPKHQGYYEDFPAWHETDLRTMVRRDRNHPSVILYSIGNEIDYPNDPYCHPMFTEMTGNNDHNKPAAERQYDANKPNMERLAVLAKELVAIVRDEDDSRPVTVAAAFPELSSRIGFIDEMDVVGYNYKEHLYEEDHKRFPKKTFLGSENGHSSEAWKIVEDNSYVCGQFIWTGIDYLGEAHGWPIRGSSAGFITTAGFAKEEFNVRSKLWGGEGLSEKETDEVSVELWKPELIKAAGADTEFVEDQNAIGYLYQILIKLPKGLLEKDILVQVGGAGELAGIDNGNLSDLTPYTSDHRETFEGKLVLYIRRLSIGDISVSVFERTHDKTKHIRDMCI